MAVGDLTKVEHLFNGANGREVVNVVHYMQTSDTLLDFDAVSLASFATDVANVTTHLLSVMSTFMVGISTRATVLTGVSAGLQSTDTTVLGVNGSAIGGDGPIERCTILSFRGLFVGRANRGRLYVAAPGKGAFNTEGDYLPGNADAAKYATLITEVAAFRTGPATTCMQPVIMHKPPTIIPAAQIITITISPSVGTQRRRVRA